MILFTNKLLVKYNMILALHHKSLCYFILLLLLLLLFMIKCISYPKLKEDFYNNIEPTHNKSNNMKKIIAFSLWGNNECYNWGALENALLAKELYPDWICRFYVSKDIIPDVRKKLEELENVEVVEKPHLGVTNAFYRFIPMFEEDCEAVLSRDTDSRLNHREKKSVNIWLAQDKDLLILRNHKYHNQLIMAGMFGVKNNVFHEHKNSFNKIMNLKKNNGKYFDDQIFLRDIYRKLKDNKLVFDSHHHFKKEKVQPYPKADFQGYIGQIVCNDFSLTNKKYGLDIKNTKINKPYSIPKDSEI